MQVKEIMTATMETIAPDLSIRDCAKKMEQLNIGSLPIEENGKLIGMVTDRDICCRAVGNGLDLDGTKVANIMSHEVAWCHAEDDCEDAAHLMEEKHIRRLAVLDSAEKPAGVLSVDDLARCSHNLAGEVIEAAFPTMH